uniref:Reverse transcriptase domain-containing protein n=1 Tax=Hordeum vulgare subsp. vulgare TaxID=112509 RepID=A0A8I6Y3E3_HORVV
MISSAESVVSRATFVYGEPRRELRHFFWDTLARLRREWNGPWLCCGDFNEVLLQEEHFGSLDRSEVQMGLFRDCLQICNLTDLGYVDPKFTWSNKQNAQCNVRVRLDRGVANGAFFELFSECYVQNVITSSSDHYALHLILTRAPVGEGPPVQHGFRYEAAWRRADDYHAVVDASWDCHRVDANPIHSVWTNLNHVAGKLKVWSRASFGSVSRDIKRMERALHYLRRHSMSGSNLREEQQLERQLCELFEREEIMARQRSRVEWLRAGDRNTAFFHSKATARRRTNRILALARDDGSVCTSPTEIKGMVHTWCENLFTAEPSASMDAVLEAIPSRVDDARKADLCKDYSNEEIKVALFQMGPTKAPGPDGFPAMFYQVHWELLKDMVCDAVRSFLGGDAIREGFCDSVIVLIPKVSNAKHLSKFRPISLCNVLYKIASKVVANRLKLVLPDITSEFQSAFVPGRLITDSALIAFECIHSIRRQSGRQPFFALKLDLLKAYDRIEWEYLHACLLRLGFAEAWVNSVMRCVTSTRYAVRVNGELTSPVVPSRGIRQGDPISPYLFVLCTEGLSCLMQQKEGLGVLQGIRNGRQGPSISHLLFADDSIFFARSDHRTVQALKSFINSYCHASGQKVNLQKSSIFFGHSCPPTIKAEVMHQLEVTNEGMQDFYLGMPTAVARASTSSFNFLTDRVWQSVTSNTGRPLSRAGKEIWLKAVVQAIPNYIMSCFQVPVTTCDKMVGSIVDHWWGFEDGRKKMHWKSWEWLSSPKALGGLGFRDFGIFNQVMLGKQAWRLATDPTSLCARVLKGRYYPDADFFTAGKPRSSSFTWHSIIFGRKLLKIGMRWNIGNGENVSIMRDNWIQGFRQGSFNSLFPIPDSTRVRYLMNDEGTAWEEATVRAFFHGELAEAILQIPISWRGGLDFISWPHDRCGQYTVRSAYNMARTASFFSTYQTAGRGSGSVEEKHWKTLWSIVAPGKMKVVLWRMAHDCLPTGHQLVHRHIPADDRCIFCGDTERVEHMFLFCPFARRVWDGVKLAYPLHLLRKDLHNMKQWIFEFINRETKLHSTVLAVTAWHIWESRNDCRNNEAQLSVSRMVARVLAYVQMIVQHLWPNSSNQPLSTVNTPHRWPLPPMGYVCVNVDAALFPDTRRMGCGVVLRDHSGSFIMSVSEGMSVFPTPELAEAMAVRRGLLAAHSRGAHRIILASDCLSFIQHITSPGMDLSTLGAVIADIRSMASDFQSCMFQFHRRCYNVVAHKLARNAESSSCNISVGVIPSLIWDELCNDIS